MSPNGALARTVILFLLAASVHAEQAVPRVVDGRIRDPQGRLLVLRGMNTGGASKHAPYLPWQEQSDFDRLRAWGFNAVRLLISWKAVEPAPGEFDDAYLEEIVRRVGWCAERQVYVLVDFHQDLYAEAVGGNGAPDWAVLGSAEAQAPEWPSRGGPWYTAYFRPEVLSAFDAFWANALVPATGRGVQDHYAGAVAFVARRLRGEPYLLGYDLMNEPFYGSDVQQILGAAARHDPLFALVGGAALLGGKGSSTAARALRSEERVDRFLAGLDRVVERFESGKLMPFYDRVSRVVRAVDPEHILFLEGTPLKTAGGRSFLRRPIDAEERPFDNVAFAHHYYDPSMADGTLDYDGRRSRAAWAIARNMEESGSQGAAFLLGEYGALTSGVGRAGQYVADYLDLFNETGTGGMYWAWEKDLTGKDLFTAFARPGVQSVAGTEATGTFDATTRNLCVEFVSDPSIGASSEVFLPESLYPAWRLATSDPEGAWSARLDEATRTLAYRTSTAGRVRIEVTPREP